MRNIIQAEFMKLKHNKILILFAAIVFLLPLLITWKDYAQQDQWLQYSENVVSLENWYLTNLQIIVLLVLPALSGVLITVMQQKEYGERAIINQLTAPTSRTAFLSGKLIVWATVHLCLTGLIFLSDLLGAAVLYSSELTGERIFRMMLAFLVAGGLGFLTLTPILAASVLQRNLFYPSILICLFFVSLASMTNVMRGILPFVLPWCAAVVVSLNPLPTNLLLLSLTSIALCGAAGIAVAMVCFGKQNI